MLIPTFTTVHEPVYRYLPLPEAFHDKGRKRDSAGVDAKSWECGVQRQVQVKNWVYSRTACLTKSDWKGCICHLRACHGAGGGVGRGRCLGDFAAQREGCED